jgi:hypothetical protein
MTAESVFVASGKWAGNNSEMQVLTSTRQTSNSTRLVSNHADTFTTPHGTPDTTSGREQSVFDRLQARPSVPTPPRRVVLPTGRGARIAPVRGGCDEQAEVVVWTTGFSYRAAHAVSCIRGVGAGSRWARSCRSSGIEEVAERSAGRSRASDFGGHAHQRGRMRQVPEEEQRA